MTPHVLLHFLCYFRRAELTDPIIIFQLRRFWRQFIPCMEIMRHELTGAGRNDDLRARI